MTPSSPDQPDSLGEFLRQQRDRLGITLEQVASATKIGIRTLQALESDHYADLPAKPFIRGFVISYARFMGLDAKDILTQYGKFIDAKYEALPNREGQYSGYAFDKREGEQSRTLLWLVMGGFIFFGGIVIFFLKPSLRHRHGGHVDKLRAIEASASPMVDVSSLSSSSPLASSSAMPSSAIAVTPSPVTVPSTTAVPSANVIAATPFSSATPVVSNSETPTFIAPKIPLVLAPTPEKTAAPVTTDAEVKADPLNSGKNYDPKSVRYKLIIRSLENVLVRYKIDQKPATRFTLVKGKILVLRGQNTIIFQCSNPKALSLRVNGGAEQLISDADTLVQRQNVATLYYPKQLAEKIGNPFTEEFPKSLSKKIEKPDASNPPSLRHPSLSPG